MTIEEFWNSAFLAALSRLSPKDAKKAADEATQLCIDHWHANCYNYSPSNFPLLQDVDIANVRFEAESDGKPIPRSVKLKIASERRSRVTRGGTSQQAISQR